MYHRFNEHKYPSTNINMEVFKKHLEIVKNSKYNFLNPNEFDSKFKTSKSEKEILITIDDAFESFYNEAWPHLRDNKIPFILFVSTEPVGNKGYMTWDQIREIDAVDFSLIGHHSHSHEYLIEETEENFILDIETAKGIFELLKKQIKPDRIIIFATHNRFFANKSDCLLEIVDGNIKTING